jgi:NADPH2:quinone reductase
MMTGMRAIRVERFGGPEVLALREVPDLAPGPGDVRVRVKAAGVNPVEAYIRAGTYARVPDLPYTPGTDAAGEIDVLGPGVTGFGAGDRVYLAGTHARRCTGTYASHVVCDTGAVHRLPDRASFAQGAALGVPYATAYRAVLQKARLRPGETLLVHGASGAVGLAAVEFAVALGATVIGTAGSESGLALVGTRGARHVLNHRRDEHVAEALALTGGHGVDVVVEMLANVNLVRDFDLLAPNGRIVIVGSRGSIDFSPRLAMSKDATVLGFSLWNAPAGALSEAHAAIGAGLAAGTLQPIVAAERPLAEAPAVHRELLEGPAGGKIVLLP